MTATTWVHARLQTGTLSALRYPNFRLYFFGQLISLSGTWMQGVAQSWLVFQLTRSELQLGLVACAAGLPSLLLSPFAGVLVERVPRRTLLICTQTTQMLLALILAFLTFTNTVQVEHVMLLAFCLGVTNAADAPARQTFISDLVGKNERSSGIALNSIMINASRIVGPSVAGFILATVGASWCFLLNGLSYIAVIVMLSVMHVHNTVQNTRAASPISQLREGLRFARQHPVIGPLLLFSIIASLTTINIVTILSAFADTVLHSPIAAYAQMNTAQGIGAVLAGVTMTWAGRRFGRGHVILYMAALSPLLILLVSRLTDPQPAVFVMGLFGFCIIMMFVNINTVIQSEVPDEFRGRVMSLYTLTFFGFSPFGALALGSTAQAIGAADAIALYTMVGGILTLLVLVRAAAVRHIA